MEAQQIEVGDEFQNDSGTITVEVVSGDTIVYQVGEDSYNEVSRTKFSLKLMKGSYERVESENNTDDDERKNFGSRPMTGQPRTMDSLTKANQRADAELAKELENGEFTRGFDPKMVVTDFDGSEQSWFKCDWEDDRSTRTRVYDRLERNGGVYVQIAHWFSDAGVNKVKTGKGFYAKKVDETEKAYQFEVEPNNENHNAETETVWVPKKAARVYELEWR